MAVHPARPLDHRRAAFIGASDDERESPPILRQMLLERGHPRARLPASPDGGVALDARALVAS